jgi:helix-turn-helix protein
MSPAESQREAQVLTQQRTNFQDRLVAAEEHAANMKKYIPAKDLKEIEKADKVLNNQTSAIPQENVNTIKTLFNKVVALPADKQAQQFNILKSNVEAEHPGYTLDTKGNLVEKGNVSAESKPAAKTEPKTQENVLKSFEGSPNRVKVDVTKSSRTMEKTYKDPITGEEISKAEFRKKYGENPK